MSQLQKIILCGFVLFCNAGIMASDNQGLRRRKNTESDPKNTRLDQESADQSFINHDNSDYGVQETSISHNKDVITACCKVVMDVPYRLAALTYNSGLGAHDPNFLVKKQNNEKK